MAHDLNKIPIAPDKNIDPIIKNGAQVIDAIDAFNVDPIVAVVEFQDQPQVALPKGNTAVDSIFGETIESTLNGKKPTKNMRGVLTIGALVGVVALLFFTGVIKLGK